MREISLEAMDQAREQKLNPFVKRDFKKPREEMLDRKNSWNNTDLTPYNSVRVMANNTIRY